MFSEKNDLPALIRDRFRSFVASLLGHSTPVDQAAARFLLFLLLGGSTLGQVDGLLNFFDEILLLGAA